MSDSEIRNAQITHTMLGLEDHGLFTFMLTLDYGGTCQGAGGWRLDSPTKNDPRMAKSIEILKRVLEICGVQKWEDIPGKYVRVDASYSKVYRIGHVIKNEWLDFEKAMA